MVHELHTDFRNQDNNALSAIRFSSGELDWPATKVSRDEGFQTQTGRFRPSPSKRPPSCPGTISEIPSLAMLCMGTGQFVEQRPFKAWGTKIPLRLELFLTSRMSGYPGLLSRCSTGAVLLAQLATSGWRGRRPEIDRHRPKWCFSLRCFPCTMLFWNSSLAWTRVKAS
jgi:hypothetical protein